MKFQIFVIFGFILSNVLCKSVNRITLYDPVKDPIELLFADTFDSIVFNRTHVVICEFFASWCGTCQKVAPHWKEIGREIKAWNNIVRIAAIDCALNENSPICNRHSIMAYPTFLSFNVDSTNSDRGKEVGSSQHSTEQFLIIMIDLIESQKIINPNWPILAPLEDFNTIFGSNIKRKFALMILEDNESYVGRKIILDFSSFLDKLVIRRVTSKSNSILIDKYIPQNIKNGQFCEAFIVINENMNVTSLKSYVENQTLSKEYYELNDEKFQDNSRETEDPRYIIGSLIREFIKYNRLLSDAAFKNHSNLIEKGQILQIQPNDIKDNNEIASNNVNMIDLESSLSYMLRSEISKMHSINNEHLITLKKWLKVLSKYFPGRIQIIRYLKQLSDKISLIESQLSIDEWNKFLDMHTSYSYLPNNIEWKHCKGSNERYRGYPCSLWTLFHVLTVNHVEIERKKSSSFIEYDRYEVISAIIDYIHYFFGCSDCSKNFMNETKDYKNEIKAPYDEIKYLWKVHNRVNNRLAKDLTEDPLHPKIQFPSIIQCSKCYSGTNNTFNEEEVVNYLIKYYSNIEGSAELDYQRKKQEEKSRLNEDNSQNTNKLQVQQPSEDDLKKIMDKKLAETEIYSSKGFTTGEMIFLYLFSIVTLMLVFYGFIKLRACSCATQFILQK